MDRKYDSEALRAEATRVTLSPGDRSLPHQIDRVYKEIEALNSEVGALEDKLAPILRPESTRINAGSIEADQIGEASSSPVIAQLEILIERTSRIRSRIQDLFARAEL